VSKLVKRMPWDGGPDAGAGQPEGPQAGAATRTTPMSVEDLPEELRALLSVRPLRNPEVEWEEDPASGLVTLVYAKQFTPTERALKRVLKAKEEVRRPLDAPGSDIWRMCDGEHDIRRICDEVDREYKERMEPVLKRVTEFIRVLAQRHLVILRREANEAQPQQDP
jgi:hypothetical protein